MAQNDTTYPVINANMLVTNFTNIEWTESGGESVGMGGVTANNILPTYLTNNSFGSFQSSPYENSQSFTVIMADNSGFEPSTTVTFTIAVSIKNGAVTAYSTKGTNQFDAQYTVASYLQAPTKASDPYQLILELNMKGQS